MDWFVIHLKIWFLLMLYSNITNFVFYKDEVFFITKKEKEKLISDSFQDLIFNALKYICTLHCNGLITGFSRETINLQIGKLN